MKARMTGDRDWLRTKFEEGKVYISLADRLDIGCHSD
jgi:hypothetical protein